MIHVVCPGCGTKLRAKKKLAGQARKCPKCGAPLQVPDQGPSPQPAVAATQSAADATLVPPVDSASKQRLPSPHLPEHLDRLHRYLICDPSKLVATWESNGQGWMLKTNTGLVPAVRNREQLPVEGDFKLVQLKLAMTDDGLRLVGIVSYQLAKRWALANLVKGDDKILSAVTGPGFLNREQKGVVRQALKDHFMRSVWAEAREVLDYLASVDYHSPGVG